jgi:hypothetical protein
MAFYMLAFASNRETLQKSRRERRVAGMLGCGVVVERRFLASCECAGYELRMFPRGAKRLVAFVNPIALTLS